MRGLKNEGWRSRPPSHGISHTIASRATDSTRIEHQNPQNKVKGSIMAPPHLLLPMHHCLSHSRAEVREVCVAPPNWNPSRSTREASDHFRAPIRQGEMLHY